MIIFLSSEFRAISLMMRESVFCHFDPFSYDARYATFGFNDTANLDEGAVWPTSFALKQLTPDVEAKIEALVKKAVN